MTGKWMLALLFAAACCCATEPEPKPENPGKEELRTLYRSNPEAFRKLMQERAEKQRAEERAFWQNLDAMGKQYRESTDPAEKERLKTEITRQVTDDYTKHLKRGRERLEELQKRVAALEKEQMNREQSVKEAVDFRVGFILSGEPMPPPPAPRRRAPRHIPCGEKN